MGFILNVINLIDEPALLNVASVYMSTREDSEMTQTCGEMQFHAD